MTPNEGRPSVFSFALPEINQTDGLTLKGPVCLTGFCGPGGDCFEKEEEDHQVSGPGGSGRAAGQRAQVRPSQKDSHRRWEPWAGLHFTP